MSRNDFEKLERNIDFEKAYQRAREVLDAEAINPDDFPRYDPATIRADKEYVQRLEEKFEREAEPDERETKQLADVLEAIILEFGEQGYWLGGGGENKEVTTVKTAKYDDLKNGTDIIVEYSEEGGGASTLGLGIDVTYQKDLRSKMERLRREAESGTLTTIRYFYSPKRNIRGEQREVPRVIVGISGMHAKDLSSLWIERQNRKLSDHPIQIIFLEEIEAQLATFLKLAEERGHIRAQGALSSSLAVVRDALEEKQEFIHENSEEIENYRQNDSVYTSIIDYARDIGEKSTSRG